MSSNRAEQFLDFGSLEYHTIQKVKFLSKNSILTKPQHFHEFFTPIFLTIFLVKSKLSTAKKSKTTIFSRVLHPQKVDNFLGKSKLNFWTKNEDFEQCESVILDSVKNIYVSLSFMIINHSVQDKESIIDELSGHFKNPRMEFMCSIIGFSDVKNSSA